MHQLWNLQKEFANSNPDCHWTPLMLGDFNTQPSDPFSLSLPSEQLESQEVEEHVTGQRLTDKHSIILEATRWAFGDEDHDYEPGVDNSATSAPPTPSTEDDNEHLMDTHGLIDLIGPKESVYSQHKRLWDQQQQQEHGVTAAKEEHDFYCVSERDHTNYAHVFKGTLDYLFIPQQADILDIVMLPPKDILKPAIPNQHFGSDRLCLLAKIVLP